MEFLDAKDGQQAGMNTNSLRKAAVKAQRTDTFSGSWQAIFWQPDLFIPQTFVIGTLVESADKQDRAFCLMDHPGRLEHFFKPLALKREFAALMSLLRSSIAREEFTAEQIPSPNFSLGTPRFVRGASAREIAHRIYHDIVIAARDIADEPIRSIGPNTEETRREVTNFLKQMADLSFERIVREHGETLSDHFLDVTLAPDNGAGSIVSACYKSLQSVELNLLRAAQDINAYASAQHRQSKAIFLLEPDFDAPLQGKERKAMDLLIGNECWKLEQSGFSTPRNRNLSAMAKDIHDWAIPLLN